MLLGLAGDLRMHAKPVLILRESKFPQPAAWHQHITDPIPLHHLILGIGPHAH